MPRRKEPEQLPPKGKKLIMHPYHLQALYGSGFIRTVNNVLQGRLTLLSVRERISIEPTIIREAG